MEINKSKMKKIVLIEDSPEVRETTEEILELADYQVFSADNGKSGVEMVKLEKPDLVICDIMMPELDGYGVLQILSKNPETSIIPFIFLTAKSEKGDMRKGMNLGADDYIIKPFEETELLEAISMRIKRSERIKDEFKEGIKGLNNFLEEARGLKELEELHLDRKVKSYRKKEVIYREDDYANYLYYIMEGKVKAVKTDTYGKDFVNEIHSSGEFFGYMTLLEDADYHETAIAMENVEVAVIPKMEFLSLIRKNRDVATNFIKKLSGNVLDREKRLLQLAYAPVRERLADALLRLKEKENFNDGMPVKYVISREDLACIVGTAKESLIRTLSELKKDGLVRTDGQEIELLDEEGLRREANGFY